MGEKSSTYKGETFVYEEKEVIKTGRSATRSKKTARNGIVTKTLIEVCPLAMLDKTSNMYNAWVEESELYHITVEKK